MTSRSALLLALLASGIAVTPACAAGECSNQMPQSDLNICYGEVFGRADAELNRVYAQLLDRISPPASDMLRTAERAWMTTAKRSATSKRPPMPREPSTPCARRNA